MLGSLTITDDLIIDGDGVGGDDNQGGDITISGNELTGLFDVTNGDVTFDALDLIQGNATSGGAIYSGADADITVSNSTFFQNAATGATAAEGGGAIFSASGELSVTDSVFDLNETQGASGSGGAIFIADGDADISNSDFDVNAANRAGGAIEIATGEVELTDNDFDGNITGTTNYGPAGNGPGNGGAVHITGDAVTDGSGGTFTNNDAAEEGGALGNSATGTMTIDDVVIDGNNADGPGSDQGGGGVFNNGGTLAISNTMITNNDASESAGSDGGVLTVGGDVLITDSDISNNIAARAGAGVEVISGTVIVTDMTVSDNVFDELGNGAGLHVTGDATNIINGGEFSYNGVLETEEGGGLWNSATDDMTIVGTTITDNIAAGDGADQGGGGVFNNGGTLSIYDADISDNRASGASGSGGGVLTVAGDVIIEDSTIAYNGSNRAGGGIEVIVGSVELIDTDLESNFTATSGMGNGPGNGGGLHTTGDGGATLTEVSIFGGEITGNTAAEEGGGLWNAAGSTLNVYGSTITVITLSGPVRIRVAVASSTMVAHWLLMMRRSAGTQLTMALVLVAAY